MANADYPLTNYNFLLRLEGSYDLPCKSISGISRENEYEYIQEGGVNDYVHIRRKPAQKPGTFQVEWYVGSSRINPLDIGTRCKLPVLLFVSRYPGEFDKPKRVYTFTGCVVIAKEFGQMDAQRSELLTEKMTIAYEQLLCLDDPREENKPVWKFEGNKVKGNGVQYARTLENMGISEHSKEPRIWPKRKSYKDIKKYLNS